MTVLGGIDSSSGTTIWHALPSSLPIASQLPEIGVIGRADVHELIPNLTLWDLWPIQLDDGTVAHVDEGELWIILSAPRTSNPDDRHSVARLRLMHRRADCWQDCGLLLPDAFSPGSREWSGSTRLDPESGLVTLWFTAAGRRGEEKTDCEQRLFHAAGKLDLSGECPKIGGWSHLTQSVDNDGKYYAQLHVNQGEPGLIKGFRDPYWFRDPADGQGYLLFTGSKPAHESRCRHDGVIGIARASDRDGLGTFELLPALIDGEGQVNEMELPHVIYRDGLYYLFWSSQARVFAKGSLEGPSGMYGMVAQSLFGPYEPLNGSGLVLTNPASEPYQAYAWKTTTALEVASFVDYWGLEGRDPNDDPALKAAQFGGTIAPMCKIELMGATSKVIG